MNLCYEILIALFLLKIIAIILSESGPLATNYS